MDGCSAEFYSNSSVTKGYVMKVFPINSRKKHCALCIKNVGYKN